MHQASRSTGTEVVLAYGIDQEVGMWEIGADQGRPETHPPRRQRARRGVQS